MNSRTKREDISHFMDDDVHLPTRTLYIGSTDKEEGVETGVDYLMAERAIKGLHLLDNDGRRANKPITVLMNNPGGDIVHGKAIYDAIKSCRNHVTIKVYGESASMGAVILQAADDRLMSFNSEMMIHYGETSISGHPKTVRKWAKHGKNIDDWMRRLFLERIQEIHPDFKEQKLDKMLDFDTILNVDQALQLNLIDGIILPTGKIERRKSKSKDK